MRIYYYDKSQKDFCGKHPPKGPRFESSVHPKTSGRRDKSASAEADIFVIFIPRSHSSGFSDLGAYRNPALNMRGSPLVRNSPFSMSNASLQFCCIAERRFFNEQSASLQKSHKIVIAGLPIRIRLRVVVFGPTSADLKVFNFSSACHDFWSG